MFVVIAADDPYQTNSFRQTLMNGLELKDDENDQLAFPSCCDGTNTVNLGATDQLKDTGPTGVYMNRFIKRCNLFNNKASLVLKKRKSFYAEHCTPDKDLHCHSTSNGLV